MLITMKAFMRGIMTLSPVWWPWIGVLVVVNGVIPLFFLGHPEALFTIVAFVIAATIQMLLLRRFGFVRLLGIGHVVPWTFLLPYLAVSVPQHEATSPFGMWLIALVVLDGISYVIDVVDVVRWARGEREPALTMNDVS